jgi:hypothetical protein
MISPVGRWILALTITGMAATGIEAKLDQLLDAIKSITLDALKVAYFQGALHGALATALVFTILIAFTRRGAP